MFLRTCDALTILRILPPGLCCLRVTNLYLYWRCDWGSKVHTLVSFRLITLAMTLLEEDTQEHRIVRQV